MMDTVELVVRSLRQELNRGGGEEARVVVAKKRPYWKQKNLGWRPIGGGILGYWYLFTTSVTLLQTLVRICVDPIDPIFNVTVQVSFYWKCYNDADGNYVNNGNKMGEGGLYPQRRWSRRNRMGRGDIQPSSYNNIIRGIGIGWYTIVFVLVAGVGGVKSLIKK